MAQSKLVSFTPVMVEGVHRQWNTAAFPDWNYDFTLVMENGDTGVASSKKTAGNWKVGEEYTYEKETDSSNRTKLKKVKSLAAAAASGSWGGGGGGRQPFESHYDKPDVQEAITKKFAMHQATQYLLSPHVDPELVTPDKLLELTNAIFAWCYIDLDLSTKVWSKDLLSRRNAMEEAVAQIPLKKFAITKWKELAARADENYAYFNPKSVPVPEPNV